MMQTSRVNSTGTATQEWLAPEEKCIVYCALVNSLTMYKLSTYNLSPNQLLNPIFATEMIARG